MSYLIQSPRFVSQVLLFSDPEVGLVCGNYWVESERKHKRWKGLKRTVPTGWVLSDLLRSFYVGLLTLVIRRTALASLAYPCDPRYHIIGDFDLVVRLSVQWKLDCVQEPVACYRLHDGNETSRHRGRQIDELECWWGEMREADAIRSCANFRFVKGYITYLKAMEKVAQADKKAAYRLFQDLPWGRLKLKLSAALALPTFVVRGFKN